MEQGINAELDRSSWGSGEWDDEADYYQWVDELTGLTCLVQRNEFGSLCGYVGVAASHPFYRKEWQERVDELSPMVLARRDKPFTPTDSSMPNYLGTLMAMLDDEPGMQLALLLDVHAGVTFAGERVMSKDSTLWFFGFDCSHSGDYLPGLADIDEMVAKLMRAFGILEERLSRTTPSVYRTFDFVKAQCEKLAKQLFAYGSTN